MLESHGFTYFLVPGDSGWGKRLLPTGFKVKKVKKNGEKGWCGVGRKHCAKHSVLNVIKDRDEFWATATVHHHAIRFKMDNKKHIMNLESFKDMLHIYPRVHGQSFDEPPFEEEILAFIHFLRRSAAIRTLTNVNINKLYQPWRSFAVIINKCLTGKSSGYDSLRLSQA
nr:hypothetical protein [Tanacetum cinerariifolium]